MIEPVELNFAKEGGILLVFGYYGVELGNYFDFYFF